MIEYDKKGNVKKHRPWDAKRGKTDYKTSNANKPVIFLEGKTSLRKPYGHPSDPQILAGYFLVRSKSGMNLILRQESTGRCLGIIHVGSIRKILTGEKMGACFWRRESYKENTVTPEEANT